MCYHDSCCYGHRVELNTEAREDGGVLYCLCYYDKMGILHVLPWQLLLWPQGGAEHWGTLCCHDKLGMPIYVAMTVVAMATGWSWTLKQERRTESCTVCAVMTRWEYLYVGRVDVPSMRGLCMPWARLGMWRSVGLSICLFVPPWYQSV